MTTVFGAARLRETEMVPATGDSNETSSVPLWVRSIEGTTMFCTPLESVVQAAAPGTAIRAAATATSTRIA